MAGKHIITALQPRILMTYTGTQIQTALELIQRAQSRLETINPRHETDCKHTSVEIADDLEHVRAMIASLAARGSGT